MLTQVLVKVYLIKDNVRSKIVLCEETGNIYITTKNASIGEFGESRFHTQIAANANGRQNQCKGKHFRYLTEEESEMFKNG